MSIYKNSFFCLQVDFPATWKINSWSSWKTAPKPATRYQLADDDLPLQEGDYKSLVVASRVFPGGPSLINSKFSIQVHKRAKGLSLLDEAKRKVDVLEYEFKLGSKLGYESQSLFIIRKAGTYNLISEVVAWEHLPGHWLTACVDGDSPESFKEAENILNNIKHLEKR